MQTLDVINNDLPLIPLMGKTMKYVDVLIASICQEHALGLTKNQFLVLRLISNGPKPQTELGIVTQRNKSSLTRLIHVLERKKLVQRIVHKDDKRIRMIQITPTGLKTYNKAMPILECTFDVLTKNINSSEEKIFRIVLTQIMQNADKEAVKITK